ncbi:lactamase [Candidatus Kuenenbacteria bacterium CG11_big_fil_rev_8_21_14_0_20_37_9]|uniref:Lactamase n=1 Tax=Candidatus Kuenenbacteria bacterium CG08_land_8_20_14_0_20_37_23 TaxID=1974617 RepID=A0A2M6XSK2_9BACT|nr:MAG: lactamase [Candidatus Kuenenbacteria bacterium CG11_big_fil_rev_8_21_14_0_20_37_9]PIU10618.1 MAG: lactamase [Candidatus Kuenenbacteria bacterium CG08_land_8_20_14_0_20_37_23]
MYIQWHGQSCFRIQAKNDDATTTLITDPYTNDYGLKLPHLSADILTISHEHKDHSNIKAVNGTQKRATPFLINGPGEYEISDVFIYGIPSWHDNNEGKERGKNIIYVISMEKINIAHLGDLGQTELTDKQLEMMNNIDILLIPVGGKYTINAEEAAKIISRIEPRIVIPMHYKIAGLKLDIDGIDKFIKEMGGKAEEMDKLKIAKKDLPQEETKLVILKP